MIRRTLSAGILMGMMALTPVVSRAQPRNDARYSNSAHRNVYQSGSFNIRAWFGGSRRESPRYFSSGFSRGVSHGNQFNYGSSWRGDRYGR